MKTNLFFDFDMTLGYRIMMWRDTLRELLLEEGIIVLEEDIPPITYPWTNYTVTHSEYFQDKNWWEGVKERVYKSALAVTAPEIAKKVTEKFPKQYCDIKYWRLFKDTLPTLKALQNKGYELYILSNHVPEAEEIIEKLGIKQYFKKIFISAKIGYEKPHNLMFNYALKHISSGLNIMIGDNYTADVKGALANGFDSAILVRKENSENYKYYCQKFKDLEKIIEEIKNENR